MNARAGLATTVAFDTLVLEVVWVTVEVATAPPIHPEESDASFGATFPLSLASALGLGPTESRGLTVAEVDSVPGNEEAPPAE